MSQHHVTTSKFKIMLGVDRPLSHVFASIFLNKAPKDAEDDNAPGFNPFSWYQVSANGITESIEAVSTYIRANGEPNFNMPVTVARALLNDVNLHLSDRSATLNFMQNHGFVKT